MDTNEQLSTRHRVDLEVLILTEVSKLGRDKYHMVSLTCVIFLNDTNELIYKTDTLTENKFMVNKREKGRDKLRIGD